MLSRGKIKALIRAAIREGENLRRETNEFLAAGRKFRAPDPIIVMHGVRALHGLRALRAIAEGAVDDQAAILGRSLAETLIDTEYLCIDTKRRLGKGRGEVWLSPKVKTELFITFIGLEAYRTARDQQKAEAMSSDLYREAVDLRRKLKIKGRTYWSGASNKVLFDELLASTPESETGHLRAIRKVFEDLSFFAHSNPNVPPYLRDPGETLPVKLTEGYRNEGILALSAVPGIGAIMQWEHVFRRGYSPRSRALVALLRRMVPDEMRDVVRMRRAPPRP